MAPERKRLATLWAVVGAVTALVLAWAAMPAAGAPVRGVTLATGDIVVADSNGFGSGIAPPGSGKIIKVDPTSGVQTLISSGGLLVDPSGVAVFSSPTFEGTWTTKTSMPAARSVVAAGVINGVLYVTAVNGASVQAAGGLTVVGTVPIPASPRGIAVNSSTHRAYVAVGDGFGNGTNSAPFYVSVIDGAADIADIAVGSGDYSTGPTHIAVNETTNRVYVNHTGANFAKAINGGTNSYIGSMSTGAYPEGIVTNPATNRLYIANTNSGNVSVINTTGDTNLWVTNIGIPGAGAGITNLYLAIIPATNRIFVTAPGLNKIFVIDGDSSTVVQTFVVAGNPSAIVANPTTSRLYAATGGTVSVLDATTGASVAAVSVGSGIVGLAVNATLNHIYATSSGSSVLTVIDGATNTVDSTVDVGATALSVGADALNGRVYVGTSAKTVVVLSPAAAPTPTPTPTATATSVPPTPTPTATATPVPPTPTATPTVASGGATSGRRTLADPGTWGLLAVGLVVVAGYAAWQRRRGRRG